MTLRKLHLHKIRATKKEDKAEDRFFLSDKKRDGTDYEYIRDIYVDEEDKGNKTLFTF